METQKSNTIYIEYVEEKSAAQAGWAHQILYMITLILAMMAHSK